MDAASAVALVGAGLSTAVAVGTAVWSRVLQRDAAKAAADLEAMKVTIQRADEAAKREQDDSRARARYRDPLLVAADELQHRLRNIQEENFLAYVGTSRGDAALETTLYRFARYFAVIEIIAADVTLLRLGSEQRTSKAFELLTDVGRTFASDQFDRVDGRFDLSRFMIWREEQRAMGEVCIEITGDRRQVAGYTMFVERLRGPGAPWFTRLRSELAAGDVRGSQRFSEARERLDALASCLRSDDPSLPSSGATRTSHS